MLNNEIYIAYQKTKKGKSWKNNTLGFSIKEEENCLKLYQSIISHQLIIKESLVFISFSPIKREIFAADFKDRVVHHLIYDFLYPFYDRYFINDSYSCRLNKGTSYGIKKAISFLRAITNNYTKNAYILKLDISGYFMNINHHILYQQNKKLIKTIFKNNQSLINLLLYLTKKIIYNKSIDNCYIRGKKDDWQGLPKNKSLFFAKKNCGLPIGNLSSQLFANLYLNDFDHFVKEKLKVKYYGRYVDDMFFMHQNKEFLRNLIPQIENYLQKKLGLNLHPNKIKIQKANYGFSFLGAIIKPNRIYCGQRIIKNFRQKIKEAAYKKEKNPAFFNSYLGSLKRFDTYNLRKKIMTEKTTILALKNLNLEVNNDYTKTKPIKTSFFQINARGNEAKSRYPYC